jgi:hypothetical protein
VVKAIAGGRVVGAHVIRVMNDEAAGDYGDPEYLLSLGSVWATTNGLKWDERAPQSPRKSATRNVNYCGRSSLDFVRGLPGLCDNHRPSPPSVDEYFLQHKDSYG